MNTATAIGELKPRILHLAYFVSDIDRSLRFYSGLLGLKELQRFDLSESVHEVILGYPEGKGGGLILMWDTKRATPYNRGDSYSRFVMMVSDLRAAIDILERNGVTISKAITQTPALDYAMVKDPDGYTIELLELKRSK